MPFDIFDIFDTFDIEGIIPVIWVIIVLVIIIKNSKKKRENADTAHRTETSRHVREYEQRRELERQRYYEQNRDRRKAYEQEREKRRGAGRQVTNSDSSGGRVGTMKRMAEESREEYSKFGLFSGGLSAEDARTSVSGIMEDRHNDWLARQLREEKRILHRGMMLDLGAAHERRCDADELRNEHSLSCNADGIDSGEC